MREGLLPLFPLDAVLLPRTPLPLHIFEERYKEMIGTCLKDSSAFGVVLARGNGVLRVGCTAAIDRVLKRHEDGRMDILTYGVERFEIISIDTERSYLRCEANFFDDDDDRRAEPETIQEAASRHARYTRLTQEAVEVPDLSDPRLSFLLAQVSPDLNFRQVLLQIRSEAERMKRVAEHLSSLAERQQARNAMQRAARTNGHGKLGPGALE